MLHRLLCSFLILCFSLMDVGESIRFSQSFAEGEKAPWQSMERIKKSDFLDGRKNCDEEDANLPDCIESQVMEVILILFWG